MADLRSKNATVTVHNLSRPKGLTHAESKALTRSRLIAVGRKHFLEHGFTKSVAEEITKEAGYTRGALHSNFGNKEGLLLEVARECNKTVMAVYEDLIEKYSGAKLIQELRDALAQSVESPDYLLMTEFEIEAFRNKTLHSAFYQFQEEVAIDAHKLVNKTLLDNPSLYLQMDPGDFITAMDSFRRGLMIRLMLSQSDMSKERGRRMIIDFFDRYGFREREESAKSKDRASDPGKRKTPKR